MSGIEYFYVVTMVLFCYGCLWTAYNYPVAAFPFGRVGKWILIINSVFMLAVCFATLTYDLVKGWF